MNVLVILLYVPDDIKYYSLPADHDMVSAIRNFVLKEKWLSNADNEMAEEKLLLSYFWNEAGDDGPIEEFRIDMSSNVTGGFAAVLSAYEGFSEVICLPFAC